MLRANFASCTIGIDRNDLKYPILFTVIIKRPNKDRHSEESHLSLDMLENGLFDMKFHIPKEVNLGDCVITFFLKMTFLSLM